MARSLTPTQIKYCDPVDQSVFQYSSADSKIYISRVINSLLLAIGDNIVLNGLDILTPAFTSSQISFSVDEGYAICDRTLINTEAADLTYPAANLLSDTGKFILHANYQYLTSLISPRDFDLKLSHVSVGGTTVTPDVWTVSDRIVLAIFDFAVTGGIITAFAESIDYRILIDGSYYYVGGYDSTNINFSKLISNLVDLTIYPNVLREGNGVIAYNSNTTVSSITHTLPTGVFVVNLSYNSLTGNVATETAYFRDALLWTRTYTYDKNDMISSWTETIA